jgi:hypothetical protein
MTLKIIYFGYCHLETKYGIISAVIQLTVKRYSIYKRKLRIIAGVQTRNSCSGLLRE